MIYRAMINSRLGCGCLCYGTAAKSALKRLDIVQAKALRIFFGAFRTTPIPVLLVEMGGKKLILENAWEWGGAKLKKQSLIFKTDKEMERLWLGQMVVYHHGF